MMNNVAMDIVVDLVSASNYFQENIRRKGIIFMSISEAIKEPRISSQVFRTVIPQKDTIIMQLEFRSSLMDLCYIPKAFASQWNFHFRINARVQDN
jgi:Fe-S cluster assembly protein SufB